MADAYLRYMRDEHRTSLGKPLQDTSLRYYVNVLKGFASWGAREPVLQDVSTQRLLCSVGHREGNRAVHAGRVEEAVRSVRLRGDVRRAPTQGHVPDGARHRYAARGALPPPAGDGRPAHRPDPPARGDHEDAALPYRLPAAGRKERVPGVGRSRE